MQPRKSKESFGHNNRDVFWVEHQPLIFSRGYKLRRRYEPGWIGSWKYNGKLPPFCEDSWSNSPWNVIDAIRTSDGLKVSLKLVPTWSEQIPITRYLSSDALRSDPRNRTVPILDVITLPDDDELALLVMPFLREFDDPPFQHLVEFIEAFRQMLQGLVFMHEHNVAHRDACQGNIMMDTSKLIPGGFHHVIRHTHDGVEPLGSALTERSRLSVAPMEYYFIDFGLSSRFPDFQERGRVTGRVGQDKSVPELSETEPYDPFPVDVYHLGGVIKEITEYYHGVRIFRPLAKAMTRQEPTLRPTSSEALQQFERIVSKVRPGKCRARVVLYSEWFPTKVWWRVREAMRESY